jgi:hypothetical protein
MTLNFKNNTKSSGRKIAEDGIKEEIFIANMLNTDDEFRNKINSKFKINLTCDAKVLNGSSKTDIVCGNINIQVKKTKKGQYGQVARQCIKNLIEYIPELKQVQYMLKDMCELPVVRIDGKKMCDKTSTVKRINNENYSESEIKDFLKIIEQNKKKILEYAFLGTCGDKYPELFVVSVHNKYKNSIVIWKTIDIINDIFEQKVNIWKGANIVEIGKSFYLQRKGGDSGKESANNFQFKLAPTLLNTQKAVIHDYINDICDC